jgi:hypothetical protein
MNKVKLYAWACDFSSNTGEGLLCQNFCKSLSKKKKIPIKLLTPNISAEIFNSRIVIKKKNYQKNYKFLHYIYPFVGVLYLWFLYLSGKKIMYVNYLPLWNFLILFLLPPKTLLGPITGGGQVQKIKKNNFIRNFLFPKFYYISLFILNRRQKKILFSTDFLKKFVNKKILNKCFFLFCLNIINNHKKVIKKKKPKIDLLFYYNNHPHKYRPSIIKLINKLADIDVKVCCVGENFPNKKVTSLGKISRKKLKEVMLNSKLAFVSSENCLSLFVLDCINFDLKIFVNEKEFTYLNNFFFKTSFLKSNSLNSQKKNIQLILNFLNSYKDNKLQKKFKGNIIKINKLNGNYF